MEASHTRISEAEILAARDWADDEAAHSTDANAISEHRPDVPSGEAAVLLCRAEALLAGDDPSTGSPVPAVLAQAGQGLDDDDRESLKALLERIQDAQANNETDDLAQLLETLEDLLFDLDVE